MSLALIAPDHNHLPGYVAALQTGWSPSTTHDVSAEQLTEIAADADAFLRSLSRDRPRPRTLPDGSMVEWLPGFALWMWDGEFCGSINFRHQPGTESLPPHVSGHVGYAVVPWKQRRGYGTAALRMILPRAQAVGLARVLMTCDLNNEGSRKVIVNAGGIDAGANPEEPEKRRFWVATA